MLSSAQSLMYHSTPLPQNEIRTTLPCGNLGFWLKYLVFKYLRLEWSGAICKVSAICSKKLQHFGKDSCWRQEKTDEEERRRGEKNYLFHSVFRKAKCGSKNSVGLEENRSECYKGLDTVGIFVDTWCTAMLNLWEAVETGTALYPWKTTVKEADVW